MKKGIVKTILIFALTTLALLVTFFIAVNTGGLHTSVSQLLNGLFVEYDETVVVLE